MGKGTCQHGSFLKGGLSGAADPCLLQDDKLDWALLKARHLPIHPFACSARLRQPLAFGCTGGHTRCSGGKLRLRLDFTLSVARNAQYRRNMMHAALGDS